MLRSIGLSLAAHHLEQHPNAECRANWRPENLRVRDRFEAPSLAALRDAALSYEGVPYVYGGVGTDGLDCSGFVNRVFAAYGYDLPRTARAQFRVGLWVDRDELQPGDLLFFHDSPGGERISHVAFHLGDGRMIHAVKGRGRVSFDDLSARYYDERFAGARRIVAMPPGRYSDRFGEAMRGVAFAGEAELEARFAERMGPCRELSWSGM